MAEEPSQYGVGVVGCYLFFDAGGGGTFGWQSGMRISSLRVVNVSVAPIVRGWELTFADIGPWPLCGHVQFFSDFANTDLRGYEARLMFDPMGANPAVVVVYVVELVTDDGGVTTFEPVDPADIVAAHPDRAWLIQLQATQTGTSSGFAPPPPPP